MLKEYEIYKEEIFGPVLSVVNNNYDEALNLFYDHEFGNGVSIFTRDADVGRSFSSKAKIEWLNQYNDTIPIYFFGGWKRSLFGDQHMHNEKIYTS